MNDPFADLFRTLRVRGAVYFAQDFCAPWGMAIPQRPYAQFHVALSGSCRVKHRDETMTLGRRDVVLFPTGAAHSLSDGEGAALRDGRVIVQAIRRGEAPFAGAVPNVRLLSGHFEFDRDARHPLLLELPEVVCVHGPEGVDSSVYEPLEQIISTEANSRRPGSEVIVERLAEIFLVQVLRAHFANTGAGRGLLAVMFDPRLRNGVAAMHARWREPLTLGQIASAAGMSRSAFAAAFKTAAGVTPMAYLAKWRLLKGRELLADRTQSIAQIAAACGHKSTEGFSRAFRRLYGQSPSTLRAGGASISGNVLGGVNVIGR
jgi:AraC-like DNA-binding protein